MNLRSIWPDAPTVHATLAPAGALLAERRALYQLAAELFVPGQEQLAWQRLDNPLFRFRIGEALAGRASFDPAVDDDLDALTTELRSGPARLRVATGAGAGDLLAEALRVIHAQSFASGSPPRPLTEAGGASFAEILATVRAGLDKARGVSAPLVDDLLPHIGLLVVLDPDTSGGLISASSRFFPGLILIDRPSNPLAVAEALIHEGAHQKFFDLAITHDFLAADLGEDPVFRPSWSGAKWPIDQVIAAFHAYACLAQFAEDVERAGETPFVDGKSLLPWARERETEIGRWLLDAETGLEIDARWLLHTFLREDVVSRDRRTASRAPDGRYALDRRLLVTRMANTGRMLLARPGSPPELHWLAGEASEVVDRLAIGPLSVAELGPEHASALAALVDSSLVQRVGNTVDVNNPAEI